MANKCGSYGEFTWVLLQHVPNAYQHFLNGTLTSTYGWVGSKPFYYFSPQHDEHPKRVQHSGDKKIYSADWKLRGIPPPYKLQYTNDIFTYDKPLLIINNKYITEWNSPPVNYITIDQLGMIVSELTSTYKIVYIRAFTDERGYWNDDQPAHEYGDFEYLREHHPEVLLMPDLVNTYLNYSYNELQLMLHAMSDHFISIAGGNSILSSYFGGKHIIVRSAVAKSDNRSIWHTDSHLSKLSGAEITGVNSTELLYNEILTWK